YNIGVRYAGTILVNARHSRRTRQNCGTLGGSFAFSGNSRTTTMTSRLLPTIAAFCLCVSIFSNAKSQKTSPSDWPQWRGPERNGISRETGLLKEWAKEGPKLVWQANDLGDGFSTPSVAGSRIYLMSNRGMENEFVQALSTQDGKVLWTTRVGNVGNPDQDPPFPKARTTPTV